MVPFSVRSRCISQEKQVGYEHAPKPRHSTSCKRSKSITTEKKVPRKYKTTSVRSLRERLAIISLCARILTCVSLFLLAVSPASHVDFFTIKVFLCNSVSVTLEGKILSGKIFVTSPNFRHFSPTKLSPIRYLICHAHFFRVRLFVYTQNNKRAIFGILGIQLLL